MPQDVDDSTTDPATGLHARVARAREKASVRVTAQDLLAERESRKEARLAAASSPEALQRRETRSVRLRVGAGVVLIAVAGLCFTGISASSDQAAAAQASSQARIDSLSTQASTETSPSGASTSGTADDQLAAVRKTSDEVASLQNQFAPLLAIPSTSKNGAPGQGFLDSVEHRKLLAPYFGRGTYLLSDEVAYSPTSSLGLTANQIDPRLPWFQKSNRTGTTGCSWVTVSVTTNAAHDLSLTDVTWVCTETTTGDLFAWAGAAWSTDVNEFTALHVGTTALGAAQSTAITAGGR